MASRAFAAVFAAVALVVCSSVLPRALASDPSQLQDFCVADGERAAGPQHARHLVRPHRLCPQRAKPAAHPPSCHRDPHRPPGHPPRRLRHIQPAGRWQLAVHQAARPRRCLRLPAGSHPLPAQ
ncbi:Os04g0617900 [Oryza sativa Japonica Group]|uniref:Os04g0617900 protein n=1 Tax=Oryza sativa subsp. japonica TaxID=39947 RepID=A0A0P0WEU7_ORYSJ|nr:hypothetical protein EE612_025582 [Oryza sativa]BAS91030.1 Os04g0617900 [Oryza sativa Japonica Group]